MENTISQGTKSSKVTFQGICLVKEQRVEKSYPLLESGFIHWTYYTLTLETQYCSVEKLCGFFWLKTPVDSNIVPLTLVSHGYWFYSGIWNFLILLEEGFMFTGERKWLMNGDEWTMNKFTLANLWTALLTIFLKMSQDHSRVGIAWGWGVRIKTWKCCFCGQTSMQMDNAWKPDGGDLERKPLAFFWMAALKGSQLPTW